MGWGTRLLAPWERRRVETGSGDGRGSTARTTIRRNYPSSCMFIFRVITNEVNRNRTKLILLSFEKSHRRLSVHSPPGDLSALG